MTTGHRHRIVKVKKGGLVHRVPTRPIWWEHDFDRVERSPYPYGRSEGKTGWYLSTLSILHRWTGLTLETRDE